MSTRNPHLKRANSAKLLNIFNRYASVYKNGEKFMTPQDLMTKYLELFPEINYNVDSLRLFTRIVNSRKDGLISFTDFQALERLLCFPDAMYKIAFQLFDTNGNGEVSFDEFMEVMTKTKLHKHIQFNMNSGFVDLYFGKKRRRTIDYTEFSQFLHDFHEEYTIEAFRRYDKEGTGFISATDFYDIMISIKRHLLSTEIETHLIETASGKQADHRVSFPYFFAFNSLLNNMELVKRIYLNAAHGHKDEEVTKEDFMHCAQSMSQITPLEVDILFELCDALHYNSGKIVYDDLWTIAPEPYYREITKRLAEIHAVSGPEDRNALIQILENLYRFTLGAIAGAIGATVVYPIDLVKTRIQNQRSVGGEVMYKHSWDCFKKVIANEGVRGLYRGLVPQLMGVAPEKATKLTINDLVRDKIRDDQGFIPIYGEIFAGATSLKDTHNFFTFSNHDMAGFCQVVFTNPVEVIKIRLQMAGEIPSAQKISGLSIIKDLGILGLYKGFRACMMRDATFSAIYFPTYAHVKAQLADENGYNHPLTLLLAGMTAGVPAAGFATPADVVKTRLQVVPRPGQTTYNGIFDAISKILKEEGMTAFWKGAPARIIRSSPQFGVTLLMYEILQRLFYIDFGGSRPAGSELKVKKSSFIGEIRSTNPDHIGGFRAARPIFTGIETKFGLCLPKFSAGKQS